MSRRRSPVPGVRDAAVYLALRAATASLQVVQTDDLLHAVRAVGGLYAHAPINRARLRRALDHIAWCFPEWDRRRVMDCAVDAYRRLFSLAAEVALLPRCINDDGWPRHVRFGQTMGAIDRLLDAGRRRRPVMFITGHCGNWELLGYTLAALGFPMHALYRPMNNLAVDRWVRETRQRRGLILIDKFGATDHAPGALERGDHLAIIADQNGGGKGVFVPFFNRLASSYKSIGLLAMRHRTPIICGQARCAAHPAFGERPPVAAQRLQYEIDVVDVIEPEDWDNQPDALFYITARYRRAIETMVRRAPEQYLWMHRYWKTRPPHEVEGRPFPPRLREKIRALPWVTEADVARIEERSARDAADLAAGRKA